MALILFRPLFWVLLVSLGLFLLWLARRYRLRWWPAIFLRVILVTLVLFGIFSPHGEFLRQDLLPRQVIIVDQSDSIPEEVREQVLDLANSWQSGGENRLMISFADRPMVVINPDGNWPDLDGRSTDLMAALQLADQFLSDSPGHMFIATDGITAEPNEIDTLIDRLILRGNSIDFIELQTRTDPDDVFVGNIDFPSYIWEGMPFEITVPIYPSSDKVEVSIRINGQASETPVEALDGSVYKIRIPPQPAGIMTLEVSAVPGSDDVSVDQRLENNQAYATIQVFPPPRVLFVTEQSDSERVVNFVQALSENGLPVDIKPPEELPTDLVELQTYDAIFLHDFFASQLSQEQKAALQIFVSRQGGELIFLGGKNSYTLGNYEDTILEPMLPVKLEPPPRSEEPSVGLILVIDRSSSMQKTADSYPIGLAREAAMRVIESLKPNDYLGVLTFSSEPNWTVPLQTLGDEAALQRALNDVSRIDAYGGTSMLKALQAVHDALLVLPTAEAKSRHIILLSDGVSFDGGPISFEQITQSFISLNTTVSTIALGPEADQANMALIAETGKGRFYSVPSAEELPRIMVTESQAAHSEYTQLGEIHPELQEINHPILSGMNERMLPALKGYLALTSRAEEGAEDVLVSTKFGDPLLSVWNYGLGKVVAWTSDIGEQWTEAWPAPDRAGFFWSQVVRYALPNPALAPSQASVQVSDTHILVDAILQNAVGEPINTTEVTFSYSKENGQVQSFAVPQSGAGYYHSKLPRPSEGAYRAVVTYKLPDTEKIDIPVPFEVNPPEEWRPSFTKAGHENLEAWVEHSGGETITIDQLDAAGGTETRPTNDTQREWAFWFLFALILSWPLEIALRRRWMPWLSVRKSRFEE